MTGAAGVGLLAVSLALGIVVGAAVVSTLEVRGAPERLLAGATVLAAEVVLLVEALSLVEQLRPAPFLVGQVLLALGALLLLLVVGGPSRVSSWWAAPAGLVRELGSRTQVSAETAFAGFRPRAGLWLRLRLWWGRRCCSSSCLQSRSRRTTSIP